MHYTFSLRNCHSLNLSDYHETRQKVNDTNSRFYKIVQKCEVCSYKLSRESSSYFFLWARICSRYPYGALWKGWKETVDNGRGRKFGDEPSITSEKRVCIILDILGKNHYLLFLPSCTTMQFFVISSLYFRMTNNISSWVLQNLSFCRYNLHVPADVRHVNHYHHAKFPSLIFLISSSLKNYPQTYSEKHFWAGDSNEFMDSRNTHFLFKKKTVQRRIVKSGVSCCENPVF